MTALTSEADMRFQSRHVAIVPEVAIQSLASERLKSTRSGSSTSERAIRIHDLEQTFASPFRAPVNRRSREPALVTPFWACSAPEHFSPISHLLDGGLRH